MTCGKGIDMQQKAKGKAASIGYIAAAGEVRQCVEIGAELCKIHADLLGGKGEGPIARDGAAVKMVALCILIARFSRIIGDDRGAEVGSAACGWLGLVMRFTC